MVGERQRLQLDDGSKVLLNTNSAFSSDVTGKSRVAKLLQGEAFFEVPVSRGQPLEVQAGAVSMRTNDSAFAVRYLDGIAQIQVQRGALDVRAPQGNDAVKLAGGDSIRVGPEGFSHRQKLDPGKDLAWIQGRLVFDNCPMGEVLAELRRYYPGWIVNTNSKLDSVAVTGNYRLTIQWTWSGRSRISPLPSCMNCLHWSFSTEPIYFYSIVIRRASRLSQCN